MSEPDILNKEEQQRQELLSPNQLVHLPDFVIVNSLLTKQNGAQYEIIRKSAHDGTLLFTKELLFRVLEPILTRTSFYKLEEPTDMNKVRYEVGLITLTTTRHADGMVDLPIGRYPGEIQTVSLPVRQVVEDKK